MKGFLITRRVALSLDMEATGAREHDRSCCNCDTDKRLLLKLGDCNPGDSWFAASAAGSAVAGCEGCDGCAGCDSSDGDVEGDVCGAADVDASVALGFPRGRPLGRDAVDTAEAAAGWASVDVVDTSKGFWEGCEGSWGFAASSGSPSMEERRVATEIRSDLVLATTRPRISRFVTSTELTLMRVTAPLEEPRSSSSLSSFLYFSSSSVYLCFISSACCWNGWRMSAEMSSKEASETSG
mmetsp:Transcript_38690/g.79065  ORF Transcript_38690/g.79065 Transcript_38690/m.79065 type:complete len:239 (-) Transcript_38690:2021-2737(-)